MHLRLPSSRLGCLLLTYVLNWTRRQELHLREAALQAAAYSCSATAWCWGDRLGLHQLQRGHGPRAIYFAFCHGLVPSAGLAPAWSCWDRLVLSQVCLLIPPRGHQKWCSVSESNRSLALERRGVSPETQRNVAIVRRLELRKPGLRGLLLEPLCIHDHVGGAHRNRTDQAICLQGKSGFLARTPKIGGWLRQRLVRLAFAGRVCRQLHGWYRRVDSNHLRAA